MTSAFSWQNSVSLCPASFCMPRQTCLLFRYVLTSYFCFLVSYDKKDIFFCCSFQKVLYVFIKPVNSASLALVVGAQTWITVILNGLPWKRKEIILLFLRLHPSTTFQTLVDHDGYSISSKGFPPTVVDIMVISVKLTHSCPFQFTDSQNVNAQFTLAFSCLTTSNLP